NHVRWQGRRRAGRTVGCRPSHSRRRSRPRRRRVDAGGREPRWIVSRDAEVDWQHAFFNRRTAMARMIPDQTFYLSPTAATQAPPETIAYIAMLDPRGGADALAVLDVDPASKAYGRQIHQVDMPNAGDE